MTRGRPDYRGEAESAYEPHPNDDWADPGEIVSLQQRSAERRYSREGTVLDRTRFDRVVAEVRRVRQAR